MPWFACQRSRGRWWSAHRGARHAPWAVLPSLASRPFTLAPSTRVWLRARRRQPVRGPAALVAGPGLEFANEEVESLSRIVGPAILLKGDDATADAVGAALRGASAAHFACHGSFVADHPMFSSLLGDGPMCLYDLERIDDPPPLVVLSACQAAMATSQPGDELVGIAASLLSMGVANVVASTVVVPDRHQLVGVMRSLHERVAAGATPSEALAAARRDAADTGGIFVCIGAG